MHIKETLWHQIPLTYSRSGKDSLALLVSKGTPPAVRSPYFWGDWLCVFHGVSESWGVLGCHLRKLANVLSVAVLHTIACYYHLHTRYSVRTLSIILSLVIVSHLWWFSDFTTFSL